MLKNRVIPVLLLHDQGLVKTVKFKKPVYVGDPLNAVHIFNEKMVDELVFLDIDASKESRGPDFDILKDIANECFMPLGYGGGIKNLSQATKVLNTGFEKVILNTEAYKNPDLISNIAKETGNQSVVVSLDITKDFWGNYKIYSHTSQKLKNKSPVEWAEYFEELGAGEIFVNSVHRDGTMEGYDLDLIRQITEVTSIPVIASGGAGNLDDFYQAINEGNASAVAAGSMFVFHGPHKAVLINYPEYKELTKLFKYE